MAGQDTPRVGVVMGSDSDLPVMQDAVDVLDEFDIPREVRVLSAHRRLADTVAYAEGARDRGLEVLIAGAGGAAHLPGVLAAATPLPVVGVPVVAKALDGLDSLLSIVQMPRGVPVATVAIGNASNAALLAIRMMALGDDRLARDIAAYRGTLADKSQAGDQAVIDKYS